MQKAHICTDYLSEDPLTHNVGNAFSFKAMKRMTKSLFLVLLSIVSLSACTGKKDTENTLRIPIIANPKTMDPAMVQDLYSAYAVSMVYEGLVEYHYLKRPHELVPLLAEAMPEVSKDGLTYTFKIRKGVKFMDHAAFAGGKGREVKAQDFIYSFLRVADPKVGSGQFWIFDGRIAGLNEWREKQKNAAVADYDHPPEGLKAVDDYTLQIKLTRKYPQLLMVLAMPSGSVVPREVFDKLGKDVTTVGVGTGPYMLSNWLQNSKLTFTRNPGFRGQPYPSEGEAGDKEKGLLDDAGKMMPFADKVEYLVFVERQPEWLNFLKGHVDHVVIPKDNYSSAIDKNTKELLPDLVKKGIHLEKVPQPEISYTAFNVEDPVLKKAGPNLRKAMSMVIDETRAIELFFNGRALPAQFIIPPDTAGYDDKFVNPYKTHNVEKAKELMAKAGYPGGKGLPTLNYETTNGTESRQQAELLQKEWAQLGINLVINYNQFSELDEKLTKKKAQVWSIAWIADYPDAENFLQLLYGPNGAPGPNASNFNNPEYNKLYEKVRDMVDSPERRALIGKMRDIFIEEMPWIVHRHRIYYYLRHDWLKNFKKEYMGSSSAKFMRVDAERRAKGL